MAFSKVGKIKLAAQVILFILNIVVLAFASKVAKFNEFFYVADLFPLILSCITLALLFVMLAFDFGVENSPLGLPQIEIGLFTVLSVLWISFNSFSTSRWKGIPFQCNTIPSEYIGIRGWCQNVQILKGLVWVEFVYFTVMTLLLLRFTLTQYFTGNKHILSMPLSRYRPEFHSKAFEEAMRGYDGQAGTHASFGTVHFHVRRGSEFLQFEKIGPY